MKSLMDYDFEPIYFKTRNKVYEEFFQPCYESSVSYDRVTGYFGSSIFAVIKKALTQFLQNEGHIRIVCSPVLSDEDIESIKKGYKELTSESISKQLSDAVDEMQTEYEKYSFLLAKLVASGKLEIKLAVVLNNPFGKSMLHDKAGLFEDIQGNVVSFQGSINETFLGYSDTGNSESFSVNTSWGSERDSKRTSMIREHFQNIWNGIEPGVTTIAVPDTTLNQIKSFRSERSMIELLEEIVIESASLPKPEITISTPYSELVIGETMKIDIDLNSADDGEIDLVWTSSAPNIIDVNTRGRITALRDGEATIKVCCTEFQDVCSSAKFTVDKWGAEPGISRRKAREYQNRILDNWVHSGHSGIFQMATGSGKTFTALCAIRYSIFVHKKILIIMVPSKILFDQWRNELRSVFGGSVSIFEYGADSRQPVKQIRAVTSPSDKKRIILTTISKMTSNQSFKLITQGAHLMMVVDEVHNIGSDINSHILTVESGFKIGLSATPKRYRDPEGTGKIMDFFNEVIEPTYDLFDAINDEALCPYLYYPQTIDLDDDEAVEYIEISKDIRTRFARLKASNPKEYEIFKDNIIKQLLIKRSRIIKKARRKTDLAVRVISEHYKEPQRWLVYCEDIGQLDEIKRRLEEELPNTFRNNLFVYHSYSESRERVLELFTKTGGVLLSIRCLDEGVDIPSIDHAIILASSQNPRQFIQRRGRVLRRYPNKKNATIYDAVVSPNQIETLNDDFPFLLYELRRALRFADHAMNKNIALLHIKRMAIQNGISIADVTEDEGGYEDEQEIN
jgi:superfamily II DNA or RNA helicase